MEKNGYRKSSAFDIFKTIFQIVGTFIILMVIGMSIVLALSAGKMEEKIKIYEKKENWNILDKRFRT